MMVNRHTDITDDIDKLLGLFHIMRLQSGQLEFSVQTHRIQRKFSSNLGFKLFEFRVQRIKGKNSYKSRLLGVLFFPVAYGLGGLDQGIARLVETA